MGKVNSRLLQKVLSAVQREERKLRSKKNQAFVVQKKKNTDVIYLYRNQTLVFEYDSLSKIELMQWRRIRDAPPKKAKVTLSNKIITTVSWNCKGTIVNAHHFARLLHKL